MPADNMRVGRFSPDVDGSVWEVKVADSRLKFTLLTVLRNTDTLEILRRHAQSFACVDGYTVSRHPAHPRSCASFCLGPTT